jgi:hypothetical protein
MAVNDFGAKIVQPDAIGYATSPDGHHWTKRADNPVFKATRPAIGRSTK